MFQSCCIGYRYYVDDGTALLVFSNDDLIMLVMLTALYLRVKIIFGTAFVRLLMVAVKNVTETLIRHFAITGQKQ
jgi:hypothetical protein